MQQQQPSESIETRMIPVRDLMCHPVAQRRIVLTQVKRMRNTFKYEAVGTLHAVVMTHEGRSRYAVVDGQHRLRVMTDLGLSDVEVSVMIHRDAVTVADACKLFLGLNARTAVGTFPKFTNLRDSGDPAALGAIAVCAKYGLEVCENQKDGGINCVTALTKLWVVDDGKTLSDTLGTLVGAWGHSAGAVEGKLVEGLGSVYATYGDVIDKQALVKRLAKYPGGYSALIGDAKGLRQFRKISLTRSIADSIIELYNRARRTRRIGETTTGANVPEVPRNIELDTPEE